MQTTVLAFFVISASLAVVLHRRSHSKKTGQEVQGLNRLIIANLIGLGLTIIVGVLQAIIRG